MVGTVPTVQPEQAPAEEVTPAPRALRGDKPDPMRGSSCVVSLAARVLSSGGMCFHDRAVLIRVYNEALLPTWVPCVPNGTHVSSSLMYQKPILSAGAGEECWHKGMTPYARACPWAPFSSAAVRQSSTVTPPLAQSHCPPPHARALTTLLA